MLRHHISRLGTHRLRSAALTAILPHFAGATSYSTHSPNSMQNPTPDGSDDKPQTPFEMKLAAAKDRLRWRRPYGERAGEWHSKFEVFGTKRNEADDGVIAFLQQPLDFDPERRRKERERKRVADERFLQQFLPERHQILGNDLAAAHFLVHRGGSVK